MDELKEIIESEDFKIKWGKVCSDIYKKRNLENIAQGLRFKRTAFDSLYKEGILGCQNHYNFERYKEELYKVLKKESKRSVAERSFIRDIFQSITLTIIQEKIDMNKENLNKAKQEMGELKADEN